MTLQEAKQAEWAEEQLDKTEGFIPDNMHEELKNKILLNLKNNLSLEQLENLEAMVKKTHFHNKNYID